jgi:hypothetical protein
MSTILVQSIVHHARHLKFDISANALKIRQVQSPKCIVWCVVDCTISNRILRNLIKLKIPYGKTCTVNWTSDNTINILSTHALSPKGQRHLGYSSETATFYHNDFAMTNTTDVTSAVVIDVSISGNWAAPSLCRQGKRLNLFAYYVCMVYYGRPIWRSGPKTRLLRKSWWWCNTNTFEN